MGGFAAAHPRTEQQLPRGTAADEFLRLARAVARVQRNRLPVAAQALRKLNASALTVPRHA